jgi:hypothetical protein
MPELRGAEAGLMRLQVTIRHDPPGTTCAGQGVVDATSLNHLADGLRVAFAISPTGPVLLDLAEVTALSDDTRRAVHHTARTAQVGTRTVQVSGHS